VHHHTTCVSVLRAYIPEARRHDEGCGDTFATSRE